MHTIEKHTLASPAFSSILHYCTLAIFFPSTTRWVWRFYLAQQSDKYKYDVNTL